MRRRYAGESLEEYAVELVRAVERRMEAEVAAALVAARENAARRDVLLAEATERLGERVEAIENRLWPGRTGNDAGHTLSQRVEELERGVATIAELEAVKDRVQRLENFCAGPATRA